MQASVSGIANLLYNSKKKNVQPREFTFCFAQPCTFSSFFSRGIEEKCDLSPAFFDLKKRGLFLSLVCYLLALDTGVHEPGIRPLPWDVVEVHLGLEY